MRKVIFIAAAFVICFTLSASAATTFVLEPDSINMEADAGSVVIYTSAFGDTILSGEINDEHGFKDFYALTVVPKLAGDNSSINDTSDVSNDVTSDVSDESSDDISNGEVPTPLVSDDASDIIPPIVSTESTDSVAETATSSDYQYKIQAVYTPGSTDKDISIPENGFVIVFPQSELGDVSDDDIRADAPVALHGINLETPEIDDGAYVEVDISEKGLLGDIPQTSDNGKIAFFAVLTIISAIAAAKFYSTSRKTW